MNDDELGRRLRDEVPDHTEGFWDRVDASLAAVADEPPAPLATDTATSPIRLTTMAPHTTTPRRRSYRLALAAVGATVVGLGGLLALTRIDNVESPSAASTTSTPADRGPPRHRRGRDRVPAWQRSPGRHCFAGTAPNGLFTMGLRLDVGTGGAITGGVRSTGEGFPETVFEDVTGTIVDNQAEVSVRQWFDGKVVDSTETWRMATATIARPDNPALGEADCADVNPSFQRDGVEPADLTRSATNVIEKRLSFAPGANR